MTSREASNSLQFPEDPEVKSVRNIIKLRVQLGEVSVRQIGKITGISYSSISRFANGADIVLSNYMILRRWALQDD